MLVKSDPILVKDGVKNSFAYGSPKKGSPDIHPSGKFDSIK